MVATMRTQNTIVSVYQPTGRCQFVENLYDLVDVNINLRLQLKGNEIVSR